MKAGDVSGVRTSSQESWLSTPLTDPNAALWASITPPANPTLETSIRRRAAAFSLDLLAHRLHLRFPEYLSSRSKALAAMIGAAMVLSAGVGALAYFSLFPPSPEVAQYGGDASGAFADDEPANTVARDSASAASGTSSTSLVRLGETAVEPLRPSRGSVLAAAATSDAIERVIQPLAPHPLANSATAPVAADVTKAGTAKAKRAAWKKKSKSARRPAKARRAIRSE